MLRGIVSLLLAIVVAAIQLVFMGVLTGCDLGGDDDPDAQVIDAAITGDGGTGPDSRITDGGPDARPAACGFGQAPRMKLNGVNYAVARVTAVLQALGCCDGTKYVFLHDTPGVTGEEFSLEFQVLVEGGFGTLPTSFNLNTQANLRMQLQWRCMGTCVPQDQAIFRSFSGELFIVQSGAPGNTLHTLCASATDVDNGHSVIDSVDLYAVDVPVSF